MVAKKTDEELTDLLTKLYTMQEDLGAKPKSSDDEKRNKAENVAVMGLSGSRKTEKKGSRFLQLKTAVLDRLKAIHQLLKDTKELEGAGYGGDNAKDIIQKQAEVREQIRQSTDEWNELDAIYKKEARKKKSKFTPEELEVQSELVKRLYNEIEKVKEAQMKGYARSRTPDAAVALNTKALAMDSAGGRGGGTSWGGSGGGTGAALSGSQQQQIMQLEQRDAEFDLQLDQIGEGIQDLAEIAQQQGEEVERQNQMLDTVDRKISRNIDRISKVNDRMKETLEEVGRSSDKLMVDIMCIVLAVGFGAVIYNFLQN